jgi:hypothetical protein
MDGWARMHDVRVSIELIDSNEKMTCICPCKTETARSTCEPEEVLSDTIVMRQKHLTSCIGE